MRTRHRRAFSAAVLGACAFSTISLAADTTYTGPSVGTWNVAANWNNGAPTAGNSTFVDNGAAGNVEVIVTATATTGTLSISSGDRVRVNNNVFFNLNGNGTTTFLNNAGELIVDAGANSTRLRFLVSGTGTISGGGTITLGGVNGSIDGSPGARVVNVDNFIHGQGLIGLEVINFTNNATIAADVNGGTLTIDPDGGSDAANAFVNTGTMRATGGGILALTGINGGAFVNTTGTIESLNASTVLLQGGANVTGGTFTTSGSGTVRVATGQNAFFTSVGNSGAMVAENNSDFAISNSFLNNGSILIDSGANATDLEIRSDTALNGTGQVILSGVNAGINGVAATRLTVGPSQTIRGQGRLGQEVIGVTNNGLIAADVNGGTLTIDPDGALGSTSFVNTGTIRAGSGGIAALTGISGGAFANTGGTIQALDGSAVHLVTFVSITGGTLTTAGSGTVRARAGENVFLTDVANTGVIVAENNSDLGLATSFLNNGTVTVEAGGNATDIEIQNDTVISGNGLIVLSGAFAGIDGVSATRLTLGAGQTLRGQGRIGQEVITLTNNGQIIADVPAATLTLDPDGGSGTNSFFQNNGSLRATNGATLILAGAGGGTFSGGGSIVADANSTVTFSSSTADVGPIHGDGTLALSSADVTATSFRASTFSIIAATARVRAGGGTLGTARANTLTIAANGRLDLSNHDFALDYTGATPIDGVRNLIRTGFNNGSWNGVGINSSSAAAAAATTTRTAIGYAEATSILGATPTTFSGVDVDATTILMRYTLAGDATLDYTVNISDFSRLGARFNQAGVWFDGDFNYDGTVNIGDFSLLAANFNKTLPPQASLPRGVVPEPALACLLPVLMLLSRRRK
jgi:hypothetical protein